MNENWKNIRVYLHRSDPKSYYQRNFVFSLAQSYSHISTPSMVLASATDTNTLGNFCSVCGQEKCDAALYQSWRENIDRLAREMIAVNKYQCRG